MSDPQLKIKNQIIIPLDLQKRSSKIREYFDERYTIKCNTTDYGVTMYVQKSPQSKLPTFALID